MFGRIAKHAMGGAAFGAVTSGMSGGYEGIMGGAIAGGMGAYGGPESATAGSAGDMYKESAQTAQTTDLVNKGISGEQAVKQVAGSGGTPQYTPDQLNQIARGQGVFPEGSW